MIERRFSHSLVELALGCPAKAYYRYVEKVETPTPVALLKGRSCDEAWNAYLEAKIEGVEMPLEEVITRSTMQFDHEVAEAGGPDSCDWKKSSHAEARQSVVALTRRWMLVHAPLFEPEAVQQAWEATLPSGRTFVGYLDVLGTFDGKHGVIDNKTGARRWSAGDVDMKLQPFAYTWLTGIEDFCFVRAIDTGKSQNDEVLWTKRTQEDVDIYTGLISAVEHYFIEEVFPRNPTSSMCGPKKCEYYEHCMPHRTLSTAN